MPAASGGGGSSSAIRAGAAFVELFIKDNMLVRGLANAQRKFQAFGSMLAGVGVKTAAIGTLALAPLAGMFKGAIENADGIQALAESFATTAEKISPLAHVFQVAGLGLEDLTRAMKEVAMKDKSGKPVEDVMRELILSLDEIEDPAKRAREAIDKFGKVGVKIASMTGELKDLFDGAPILDSETALNAKQVGMAFQEMKLSIMGALLPAINVIMPIVAQMNKWVKANKELVGTVAAIGAGLLIAGALAGVIGTAVSSLSVVFGILPAIAAVGGGVIGLIASVPAILAGITIAAGYLAATSTNAGQAIADEIGGGAEQAAARARGPLGQAADYISDEMTGAAQRIKAGFTETFESAKSSFGAIVTLVKKGDLEGALAIAVAFMRFEWAKLVNYWVRQWVSFQSIFINGWHETVITIKRIWAMLTNGLAITLAFVMDGVIDVFNETIGNMTKGVADLLEKVGSIETAKELRAWVKIEKLGPAVREDINKQGQAEDKALRDKFAAEQKLRDAEAEAKVAALGLNQQEVDAARAELQRLIGQVKQAAPQREGHKDLTKPLELANMVRGVFQAPNYRQIFAVGDKINEKQLQVERDQLKVQLGMLKVLENLGILRIA